MYDMTASTLLGTEIEVSAENCTELLGGTQKMLEERKLTNAFMRETKPPVIEPVSDALKLVAAALKPGQDPVALYKASFNTSAPAADAPVFAAAPGATHGAMG